MKKVILSLITAVFVNLAIAQTDPNQQQPPPGNEQTKPETNPNSQNPNTQMHNWDLYGGKMLQAGQVPPVTMQAFNNSYPNQQNTQWYSYPEGYIVAYPGPNNMYRGVLYDKNGKMTGTVMMVKYSTLSASTVTNIKKKYPD